MRLSRKLAGGLVLLALSVLFWVVGPGCAASGPDAGGKVLKVVASANFYGDVVAQIGGARVTVTSILSDPNVDPHLYESNVRDAKAIAAADLAIENGGGYDDWMDKLLAASPNAKRVLLKAYDIAGTKLPDNEHVWYSVANIQQVAESVAATLTKLDPSGRTAYQSNLQTFKKALDTIREKTAAIKAKHNGTPVGLTETIFLYQTGPLGLKVLTPLEFQKAVAEGEDPPASAVISAENQVKAKKVKVLIYNKQTETKITAKLQAEAKAAGIPIVAVTETMPVGKNYQTWILDQLNALEQALGK